MPFKSGDLVYVRPQEGSVIRGWFGIVVTLVVHQGVASAWVTPMVRYGVVEERIALVNLWRAHMTFTGPAALMCGLLVTRRTTG
jgi:hypothetical protein